MNKLMTVFATSVCVASLSGFASAAEAASENDAAALGEEEGRRLFRAGVDVDLFSAYVWRNVVQTDRMVLQPGMRADFVGLDPFYLGFLYWQNWDLSDDRRDIFRRRLNESDYNVHVGATAWKSEDLGMSVKLELGHDWYTYHFSRRDGGLDASPSTRELYLNGAFSTPFVDLYGQVSRLYDEVRDNDPGFCYELGFRRTFELGDALSLGLDWNTSFADRDYCMFITGCEERGFLGTTLKAHLSWAVTDWMSLVGAVAYTGLLDSDVRHAYNAAGARDDKDILWGGVSAKFAF